MEWEIGAPGKAYTKWAADMAVKLGTGVPWIMCKQEDAPDPMVIINSTIFFFARLLFAFMGSISCSLSCTLNGIYLFIYSLMHFCLAFPVQFNSFGALPVPLFLFLCLLINKQKFLFLVYWMSMFYLLLDGRSCFKLHGEDSAKSIH